MRKFLFALAILIIATQAAYAGTKNIVEIKVNGMVCDFCAQAIWKVFEEYDAVESVNVDLDKALVSVTLKPEQSLSDEEIQKGITYAGYDLVSIEEKTVTTDE